MGLFDRMRRALSPSGLRTDRDIGAARQAELAGDLVKAIALFGRAGANDEVARVMILRAEAEPDPKTRLQYYVQAASIAPAENPVRKIAQIRRAQMMTLLVKGGALSAASRADLLAAARDLETLGEPAGAADAYKLAGDHESEARALAAAGKIDELETLLDEDQAETRRLRQERERLEEIDLASATGRRREALAMADAMGEASGGAARIRASTMRAKRVLGPVVHLVIDGEKIAVVLGDEIVIGRSEGQIQIASHAISRKHLRVGRSGSEFVVSDLQSRNGTTMRGVAIGGDIAVGQGIELSLGKEVPARIAPIALFSGGISISIGGSTYVAFLGPARLGIGDWELVSGAESWIELAFTTSQAYLGNVALTSGAALLIGDVIARERGGKAILELL